MFFGPFIVPVAFFIALAVLGAPFARAFARRIEEGTPSRGGGSSPDVIDRLERIERAIDTMAIEVERISEAQRFTTRLLADCATSQALGDGRPLVGPRN